jgi:ankyrin repeat protein
MELKLLQELDDLNNVNLTHSDNSYYKPDIIPMLDLSVLYEEEDERQISPRKSSERVEPLPKHIPHRFIHYPIQEINNKSKLIYLKNLRLEKIRNKVQERQEIHQRIFKDKVKPLNNTSHPDISNFTIGYIMEKVKSESKLKPIPNIIDLNKIKIKKRFKQSMELLNKGRIQKNYMSLSIIHSVLSENIKFVQAHIDKYTKDSERIKYINATDQFNRTGLHYASGLGSEAIVSMILEAGINPFIKDFKYRTALHYASFSNSAKIVTMILKSSKTYQKLLKTNSSSDIQAKLLKKRNNSHSTIHKLPVLNESPNVYIDFTYFHEGIQSLLESINKSEIKCTDFNTQSKYIDLRDDEGRTALHLAVINEKSYVIKALLESGASISIEDSNNKRPLELSKSKFITSILVKKIVQNLGYKKSKNSIVSKDNIDNRDLKTLSSEDIYKYMKNEMQEEYLM